MKINDGISRRIILLIVGNSDSFFQATDEVIESETKDELGVKSRDSELDTSTLSRRKNTKRSEFLHQAPGTASLTQTSHVATAEPSRAMSFKIIMGVAIMSLIIGVILGKRY